MRSLKVSRLEICPLEPSIGEIRPPELGALKTHFFELRTPEVCVIELGLPEVRTLKMGIVEDCPLEPGPALWHELTLTYYAGVPVLRLPSADERGHQHLRTLVARQGLSKARIYLARDPAWPGRGGLEEISRQ